MRTKRIIFLLLIVFPLPVIANDEVTVVHFEGIGIPCEGCRRLDEELCEAVLDGELTVSPCTEVATAELSRLAAAGYDGVLPTVASLRNYLLTEKRSGDLAAAIIGLLLQVDIGKETLKRNSSELVSMYAEELERVFSSSAETPELWLHFWKLYEREGMSSAAGMRAVIAARHESLELADLIETLSVADLSRDVAEMQAFERALEKLKPEWSKQIKKLRVRVERCELVLDGLVETDSRACTEASLKKLPEVIRNYLHRVQVQRVIGGSLGDDTIDSGRVISKLSSIDYKAFRTPETHRLLEQALERITPSSRTLTLEQAFSVKSMAMLETFAEHDEKISKALGEALIEGAEAALNRDEFVLATGLIENSLKVKSEIKPEFVNKRVWLISRLQQHIRSSGSSRLAGRVKALYTHVPKKSIFGPITIVLVIIGAAIGGWLGSKYFRKQEIVIEERERWEELTRALAIFGLKIGATEDDLNHAYRSRAKEMHPDAGGDKEAFATLSENYKKARKLLSDS